MFPSSRQIKFEAKLHMGRSMPIWMKATVVFVGLQLLAYFIGRQIGQPPLMYYGFMEDFPDAVTGFFTRTNGVQLVYCMEAVGIFVSISLRYQTVLYYYIGQLVFLILLAPLKIAVLERLWKTFRGEPAPFPSMLRWYGSPKRMGKAILIDLILSVGCRLVSIVLLIPGSYLYFYSMNRYVLGSSSVGTLIATAGIALLILGAMIGFYLYTRLLPVSFCLAAQPEYSLGKTFRRGFDSIRGYEKKFFYFRLSFFFWYVFSSMFYGVLQVYLLPYLSFASFQFLQEAARDRQDRAKAAVQQEVIIPEERF